MAKKPTVTTVASGYYGRQALNDNFEALRDAFDNTLSRDGSTPNAMGADLDMNSNDILNVGEIDVQALSIGGVDIYPGNTQIATTYATQNYTGNGSTTTYAMGYNPGSKTNVDVYIDGVYQNQDAFNITGTNLTFTAAPPLNSAIEIKVPVNVTSLTNTDSSQIVYNQGGAGAVTTNVKAKLQEFVSVKDFGAVGDGVTDDTAAINSALTNARGRAIYFPAGEYKITSKLTVIGSEVSNGTPTTGSFRLFGEDQANTKLTFSGVSGTAIEGYGWNVVFENFYISGAEDAIYLRRDNAEARSFGRWVIRNVVITGCVNGIQIKGGYFNAVENCRISQITGTGLHLFANIGTADRTTVTKVSNVQVYNDNTIAKSGTTGFAVTHGGANTFINCDCSGFEYGIYFAGVTAGNNFLSHYEERNDKPVYFDRGTSSNRVIFGAMNSGSLRQGLTMFGGDNVIQYGNYKFDTNGYRPNLLINGGLEGQRYETGDTTPNGFTETGGTNTMTRTGVFQSDTTSYRGRHPFARGSQVAYKNPGTANGIGLSYPYAGTEGPSTIYVGNRKEYIAVAFIKLVSGNGPRLRLEQNDGTPIVQSNKAPAGATFDGWYALTLHTEDALVDIEQVRLYVDNDAGETGEWYVDDIYFLPAEGHIHTAWSDAIDLSGSAYEGLLFYPAAETIWHDTIYLYEEASSADAGITLTTQLRSAAGAASVYATHTTEVSKPIGYRYFLNKTSYTNKNGAANPNEAIFISSPGGKTGTGVVRVGWRYITL